MKKMLCLLTAIMCLFCMSVNLPARADGDAAIPGGALGLKVLSEIDDGTGIALVSPQSLYLALGMAAQGARGDTLDLLEASLNVNGFDADKAKAELDAMQSVGLKVANAYFKAGDISLKPEYEAVLKDAYSAQGFAIDDDIVSRVNDWAAENTDGMIREVLTRKPDDDTKLILTNALLMDAKWQRKFESYATVERTFHGASGDTQVDMMFRRGDMLYGETDGAQVVYMPYEAEGLGMYVILPDEQGAAALLVDMAARMSEGGAPDELTAIETADVALRLPRVNAASGGSLKEALKAAGLGGAMELGADFSGMTDDYDLFIGNVIQNCALEVGEEGTRAAAVTAVAMDSGSAYQEAQPKSMTVDRPYIMLITLSGEGSASDVQEILFAAVVNDIT
ncbi:MAG: hypothetical protein MR418_06105 [Clostridiales bacterium]|nr:hypothetical protein [Clostridiales bacterium]MDY4200765.1 serpin family protein [Candidatus Fimadaptatus sp.]